MRREMSALAAIVVVGAAASLASAGTSWMERPTSIPGVDRNHSGAVANVTFGDAGELMSDFNVTMGDQPLNTITGTLAAFQRTGGRSLDADLYCIRITNPASFSAIATGDTLLALFRINGEAVAYNDNRTDSLTSTNPRLINNGLDINGNPVVIPNLTPGDYLLGISRVDGSNTIRRQNRPLDANGNLIFPGMVNGANEVDIAATVGPPPTPFIPADPNAFTRRADLGPITPGTLLSSWELFTTAAVPFNANYTITLTGTTYSDIPAPSAAGLLAVGVLALRRRR